MKTKIKWISAALLTISFAFVLTKYHAQTTADRLIERAEQKGQEDYLAQKPENDRKTAELKSQIAELEAQQKLTK